MKFPLPLILLLSFLASCTTSQERALEATLTFAGTNRAELEKVLHHYKDEPLKQAAARFLITHMKDRHFYRSTGIDSIRHYLTVAARQESCLPFDVEQKWGAYDYRQETPIYDAQVLTAGYLIENIEEAFEAWHYREWGQHYSFDDFCRYLLPYWIGDDERLVYENVPRGALLWLHNHTRGVEEQVFRWLDGKQVFCYRL